MSHPQAKPLRDVTLVDAASLFDVAEVISERLSRPKTTIDYAKLKGILDQERISRGWRPAASTVAFLSVDPESEGQRRFKDMLRHGGYDVADCHYRDSFVSLPAGRTLAEASSKPITSLASRLAYMAGLLARQEHPQVLVVTHCFELWFPLVDLALRVAANGGRVGAAYFAGFMDYRWKIAGLLDESSRIEFFDLEQHSRELTGVDLAPSGRGSATESRGVWERI